MNNLFKITLLALLSVTVLSLFAAAGYVRIPVTPQEVTTVPVPHVPENYSPPIKKKLTASQVYNLYHTVWITDPGFTQEDFYWMRLNIYFEDRQNGDKSMKAIALVTKNRVEDRKYNFGNTVKEVVTKAVRENGAPVLHKCQFSWYCNGLPDKPYLDTKAEYDAWMEAGEVARQVLLGEIEDFTHGSLYYHADYVNPFWSDSENIIRTVQVADHIYYSRID